jgi:transposase
VRWCARADALFDVPGLHVLDVARDEDGRLVLAVESDQTMAGCPGCGVIAGGHGRRRHRVADAPCFAASTVVVWRKRVWRCREPACPVVTFSEQHPLIAPRAKLTARAVGWATDALTHDDTTISALARHLGVDWHTLWDAVEAEARHRLDTPDRLAGVRTLGVDEHVWRPGRRGHDRAVTAMVDLTRDEHGCVHARLLDVVPGRSGTAYAGWLADRPDEFVAGVEQAALDPFRGGMRTPSATSCPTRSPCSTRSTWSGSAPPPSTRSAAASSSTPSATAATAMTRCIGSAVCSATASNTSP